MNLENLLISILINNCENDFENQIDFNINKKSQSNMRMSRLFHNFISKTISNTRISSTFDDFNIITKLNDKILRNDDLNNDILYEKNMNDVKNNKKILITNMKFT